MSPIKAKDWKCCYDKQGLHYDHSTVSNFNVLQGLIRTRDHTAHAVFRSQNCLEKLTDRQYSPNQSNCSPLDSSRKGLFYQSKTIRFNVV